MYIWCHVIKNWKWRSTICTFKYVKCNIDREIIHLHLIENSTSRNSSFMCIEKHNQLIKYPSLKLHSQPYIRPEILINFSASFHLKLRGFLFQLLIPSTKPFCFYWFKSKSFLFMLSSYVDYLFSHHFDLSLLPSSFPTLSCNPPRSLQSQP